MNSKFSIVIPYHTHPQTVDLLKRQLNYYHFNDTCMDIIVAISGDIAIKDELVQFIGKLDDPRITFFYHDENDIKNVRSLISKIYNALTRVKTPYVAINGADDVLIPEEVEKGGYILENNAEVAAVKGHTAYFNHNSGDVIISKDLEIRKKLPLERLRLAMKDRDSIFYIIRKSKDLLREYANMVTLSNKSEIVGNSLYHFEHFKALSVASLGNVCILDSIWRVQGSHDNNHTSHTQASFLRVQSGVIHRSDYDWFTSVTPNMNVISYDYYKFLWACHQITGIHVTFKQIVYNFLHKKCSAVKALIVLNYFLLNIVYKMLREAIPICFGANIPLLYGSAITFSKTSIYSQLKKYYFDATV